MSSRSNVGKSHFYTVYVKNMQNTTSKTHFSHSHVKNMQNGDRIVHISHSHVKNMQDTVAKMHFYAYNPSAQHGKYIMYMCLPSQFSP